MRVPLHPGLLAPLALFAAACGSSVVPLQAPQAEARPVEAVVVDYHGHIGTPELALGHRALREANAAGLARVVFRFDSAGSIADDPADLIALLDRVQQSAVPTVAYVRGKAIGSAAHLALMCDQLFLESGASIGAIAPTDTPLEELLGLAPPDAERRRLERFRQELRQRLEQKRTRLTPDAIRLCEGMADPTLELVRAVVSEGGVETVRVLELGEVKALAARGVRVIDQTPVTRPVDLTAREAEDAGLSRGTLQSLEHLITDHLLLDRSLVGMMVPNWSEHMVGWLELMQPALLVLGFVLLILEIKTPGFGLPGALGVLLLGLAMFYSYLVGLAEVSEILLFFLGIAALAVEIFLLPGTIAFGAIGFLALVFALVLSRQTFFVPSTATEEEIFLQNLTNLTLLFVLVLVVAAVLWRLLPRMPVVSRLFLPPPDRPATGASTEFDAAATAGGRQLIGRVGVAVTVLRPAGVVELDGEPVDVVTRGEYLEPGTPLKVVAVEGNRVVVEAVAEAEPGASVDPRASERGSVGLVLLLTVIGLALLVAEVMFVSFGVISLLSGLCLVGAVFLAFQESTGFGWGVLVSEALAAPVVLFFAFRMLPNTRIGRAILLSAPTREEVAGQAEERGLQELLQRTGITLSALRPAGFARIDGRKVDVVTRGEMIDKDSPVRVVEVLGNRVVVARHTAGPDPAAPQDGRPPAVST